MRATNVVTEERRVSESGSGQGSMYPLPARSGTFRHVPALNPEIDIIYSRISAPHWRTWRTRNRYGSRVGAISSFFLHTLQYFGHSKSISLESGSNQLFFFAYLTVLLTLEIDIAREWEQSHFQNAIHSSLLKGRFHDASDDIAENLTGFR